MSLGLCHWARMHVPWGFVSSVTLLSHCPLLVLLCQHIGCNTATVLCFGAHYPCSCRQLQSLNMTLSSSSPPLLVAVAPTNQ